MYDAFPDLADFYDSVPAYPTRRDVHFYVDEAKQALPDGRTAIVRQRTN